MKKLMFALVAGVAATVATAASITQSDFETGYTAGTSKPTTVEASKFGYAASNTSEDGSVVKAYDAEVTAYADDRNAAFVGANNNYLELNTDGGTLYRSINDIPNNASYGAARNVTSSLYIDTLVQFTVCDSAPDIDNDAKLAIWLQTSDDEATTNLMVRAKTYAISGDSGSQSFDGEVTNFVIGAANTYQAGTWYRLTVEAVPNVFSSTYGAAGFKIRIDGDYVKADRAAFTGSTNLVENMVADYKGLINANDAEATIFLPINGDVDSALAFANNPLTLCAVGFSGTGAVDDILFTEDNPFFTAPTTLDFTLTLAENVSSVTYSISGAAGVTVNTTTTVPAVPVGATITLSNITTATPVWRSYEPAVAAGANASVAVDGTNVTLKARGEFLPTDENLTTAGATVSAVDTSTTMADTTEAVADALNTLGITNEGILDNVTTKAGYQKLLAWAEKNGYSKSRINDYPFAYERMSADLPIEVLVALNVNDSVITSYVASQGTFASEDYPDATCYKVDAGMPLVLSNFVFASSLYELNADTSDETWAYSQDITAPDGFSSVTVANGVVTFTPALTVTVDETPVPVEEAFSGIGYNALTAVAQVGEAQYPSLKAAIDAATAGQTVAVLADCTVAEPITFNYGITVSNDYTVSITTSYALRFANGTASPVTFCGSGTFYQATNIQGSPFLVGSNESKSGYGISDTYAGSVVLNSGTLEIPGAANNLVKVENGTFVMNGGSILGGNRGVKADADAGNFTSTVTINGGFISNIVSKTAVAVSADTGTAALTINGGDIVGPITCDQKNGTATLTIPSNSTARFSSDQTKFCVAGYGTKPSGDWYVVAPRYTLTFISGEGSMTTNIFVFAGDTVTSPTAAEVVGKTFSAWSPAVVTPAAANATYTAQYAWNTYTVTFAKNNESATGTMADQTFTYNVAQALTANAFVLEGYTFAGWATTAEGEKVYDDEASLTLTAGLTLYAKWEQNAPPSPIPAVAGDATAETVNEAVEAANFTDDAVATVIGGDPVKYNEFKTWAASTSGGEAGVVASAHAAASYQVSKIIDESVGAKLFANEPTLTITEIEPSSSGSNWDVTVELKDGDTAVQLKAATEAFATRVWKGNSLQNMSQCTASDVTAAVQEGGTKVKLTVTPPETGNSGFIKIKAD